MPYCDFMVMEPTLPPLFPDFRFLARSVILVRNSSYTVRPTRTISVPMHVCPLFVIPPHNTPWAALSRLAFSVTIATSFPPSSMIAGINLLAAWIFTFFPISVDPVKKSISMSWFSINAWPVSPPGPVST